MVIARAGPAAGTHINVRMRPKPLRRVLAVHRCQQPGMSAACHGRSSRAGVWPAAATANDTVMTGTLRRWAWRRKSFWRAAGTGQRRPVRQPATTSWYRAWKRPDVRPGRPRTRNLREGQLISDLILISWILASAWRRCARSMRVRTSGCAQGEGSWLSAGVVSSYCGSAPQGQAADAAPFYKPRRL